MTGKGESCTCEVCGKTFTTDWSDEEAQAEAETLFPAEHLADGVGVACDACFQEVMAWARVNAPELLR